MTEFGKLRAQNGASPKPPEKGGSKTMAIVFSGAAFVLAAAAGATLTRGLSAPNFAAMTADDVTREMEKYAEDNPGVASVFTSLRTHYPETYDKLAEGVAGALRKKDFAAANQIAFESTRGLGRSKAKFIASASAPRLNEWARSGLALMTAARAESPALCAQVAFGNVQLYKGFPSNALMNAAGRHAAATIEAFHEGEIAPKKWASPSSGDQRTVASSVISQGVKAEDASKLQNLATIRALPEKEQCELGIKLMRGVVATPEPIRGRILAAMAAETARLM